MNSDRTTPVVHIEKVEKWFGRTSALRDINLTVQPGEFMVFLGRNGAGKSTLLRVIARIIRPNSGKVEVCGVDIQRRPEAGRERLGFVAHNTFLYRNLTARENLKFFAKLYQVPNPEERIRETLGWVGLERSANRQIQGFSRGMQQRLAIARATLHNPQILLLDEPFSGLDLEVSELLAEWLKEFVSHGKTILMATHDLVQGLDGAHRWAILDYGKIVEEITGSYVMVRDKYRQFLKERKSEFF